VAINLKPTDAIAAKFAKRAGAAGQEYKDGVLNPKRSQSQTAMAAADNWHSSVSSDHAVSAFKKGLSKAGDEKWSRKAAGVGANRYPDGVRAAQPDYAAGVAPYFSALASLTLPPRGLKGTNNGRVQIVVDTLRKIKLGG
jgi:hypothetical protein